jgi:error-prone DNA polymerase
MAAAEFTHLHVASAYSLRYGTATPAELADRAASLGMPALALTDRDGLYGAFKHVQACAAAGIKPLLGADLAVRADDLSLRRTDRGYPPAKAPATRASGRPTSGTWPPGTWGAGARTARARTAGPRTAGPRTA